VKGWGCDLTQFTQKEQMPKELVSYIKYIENAVKVPITIVSIGPDRKQTIKR